MTCLNTAAPPYGDAAIAAMSIVTRVSQFAGSAMIGFGQGFQPVCGFNYGARKYERVTRGFRFCVRSSSLILLTLAVLGFLFAPQIIAVFRGDDPEVVRIGALTLRLQCISFPITGFVVMSNMLLQNIAMTLRASIVAGGAAGTVLRAVCAYPASSVRPCRRAVLSGSERPVRLYSGALRHASGRAAAVRRKKSA